MSTLELSCSVENLKKSRILRDAQHSSRKFFLITNENAEKFLVSEELGLAIRIRQGGYIPKSGLLVFDELYKLRRIGRALDVGTGETGLLANGLLALGASQVIASDIDPHAIKWARQASNRSSEISWNTCDLLPSGLSGAFDTIVSNPPQMPMAYPGHSHDYGGSDGRNIIKRIIKTSSQLLSQEGSLIMLCFDFLGVTNAYGCQSLPDFARTQGLRTSIIAQHQRQIRKGGKTEENIGWIESICPGYAFQRDGEGNFFHEVFVLQMTRAIG